MENDIVVLGNPTGQTETPVVEKTTPVVEKTVETKIETLVDAPKKEVIEKETIDETKLEDTKKSKEEEEKVDAKKETTDKEKEENEPFKVAFKGVEEKSVETKLPKETHATITEEAVIGYLQANGINVNATSELSPKEILPTSVAEFKKFVETTGRNGIQDFYNSQRDWSKESKETTIKEYLRYENPKISEDDVNRHYDLKVVENLSQEEIEDLEPRDLREREQRILDFNSLSTKALSHMQAISKEYNAPMESTAKAKPPTTEEIAELYRPYRDARDKSLENLNETLLSLDVGDIKIPISKEMKKIISDISETTTSFLNPFADDKGKITTQKSTDPLMEGLLWYHPETRGQMQIAMIEQFHALVFDKFSKENRNVNLDKMEQTPNVEQKESGMVTIEGNKDKESFAPRSIF
tara:strand:+ start:4897 stop:6129 length:1233 start_codon:yes stop_codon:yes gene_type:complete